MALLVFELRCGIRRPIATRAAGGTWFNIRRTMALRPTDHAVSPARSDRCGWSSSETTCARPLARLVPEGKNMANTANKYVYFFGKGKADGKSDMRALLGGKGANLAEMTNIGLP